MAICDVGPERACRSCGSSVLGHVCSCGNLMCSCEPCEICQSREQTEQEEERERGRFEAEQEKWREWGEQEGFI